MTIWMRKLGLWAVLLVAAGSLHAQGNAGKMELGASLPEFELVSGVYGKVASADLQGKVVLISLFATWCPPCQKELADVQKRLYPTYKDNRDFCLLVVGREHTDEELSRYNERKNFTFPLYPDPERKFFSLFAEKDIPRAYLFDRNGKLVYRSSGYSSEEFGKLLEAIEKAL